MYTCPNDCCRDITVHRPRARGHPAILTINGEAKTFVEWSRLTGKGERLLRYRAENERCIFADDVARMSKKDRSLATNELASKFLRMRVVG